MVSEGSFLSFHRVVKPAGHHRFLLLKSWLNRYDAASRWWTYAWSWFLHSYCFGKFHRRWLGGLHAKYSRGARGLPRGGEGKLRVCKWGKVRRLYEFRKSGWIREKKRLLLRNFIGQRWPGGEGVFAKNAAIWDFTGLVDEDKFKSVAGCTWWEVEVLCQKSAFVAANIIFWARDGAYSWRSMRRYSVEHHWIGRNTSLRRVKRWSGATRWPVKFFW